MFHSAAVKAGGNPGSLSNLCSAADSRSEARVSPAFAAYGGGPGSLPHAEAAASEVLSLPVCPFLTADNREAVIREIVRYLTRGGA